MPLTIDQCNLMLNQLRAERPEMFELLFPMVSRMNTKGADYSGALKSKDNLDEVEEIGIPAWKGVIVRMSDKWSRLKTFTLKETYRVKDESFEDTLFDLAVYCLLCVHKFRQLKKSAECMPDPPAQEPIQAVVNTPQ